MEDIKGNKLFGIYLDNDNFGGRFEITTTARNQLELKGAEKKLQEWLAKKQ